ncbi:unnamed protein product [Cuscuta europaea]|uniref:Uncharacterized protein n=1 Tax=Cuscuta europaea TaxID=41803 RepID=A0A9P0YKK2_CUSEU|nr:unnamed protein product [Cuscuta europaea]
MTCRLNKWCVIHQLVIYQILDINQKTFRDGPVRTGVELGASFMPSRSPWCENLKENVNDFGYKSGVSPLLTHFHEWAFFPWFGFKLKQRSCEKYITPNHK